MSSVSAFNASDFLGNRVTTPAEYLWASMAVYSDLRTEAGTDGPDLDQNVTGVNISDPNDTSSEVAKQIKAHRLLETAGWVLSTFIYGKNESGADTGYRGAVYYHEDRNEYLCAHRGTQNPESFMADAQAVVGGDTSNEFVNSGLSAMFAHLRSCKAADPAKFESCKISTAGHSLGGFCAGVFGYIIARPGLTGELARPVSVRSFEAPGWFEYVDSMQPTDSAHQVDLSNMDAINFVGRPDLVTTVGALPCTIVNLDGHEAKGHEGDAIKGLTSLLDVHSKSRLMTRINPVTGHPFKAGECPDGTECLVMERWPLTSRELAKKAFLIATGDISTIVSTAAGAAASAAGAIASTVISGVRSTVSGISKVCRGVWHAIWRKKPDADRDAEPVEPPTSIVVDPTEAAATLKELKTALTTGYAALPPSMGYGKMMHIRHFRAEVREFLLGARFFQGFPNLMTLFFNRVKKAGHPVPEALQNALKNLRIAKNSQVWFEDDQDPNTFYEALEQYVATRPDFLNLIDYAKLYFDTIVNYADNLKDIAQLKKEIDEFRKQIGEFEKGALTVVLDEVDVSGQGYADLSSVDGSGAGDLEKRIQTAAQAALESGVNVVLNKVRVSGQGTLIMMRFTIGEKLTVDQVNDMLDKAIDRALKFHARRSSLPSASAPAAATILAPSSSGSTSGAGAGAGGASTTHDGTAGKKQDGPS